ncbi:RiPP maturation radical SAM C-methyltransferase [Thermosulfurimonas sp. F29]|uniref:RiPP maturation radical SAM C-methyltransferase n=1 Tax=Thermosulfurimonas sp. F29 TaxID=2867247 RepID=UPI001C83BA54|nr:RiPP maturation radical SAM C-methyltransferase [Thermosulfurimonas sp. F29]MBX6422860.1 RiPP maturation radical SAM C-methyltransferase [Thermosulfurimonas sp. F29]
MRVALLALPWPLFNRPSVQLGVLKGYLRRVLPEVEVHTYHPYLSFAAALGYEDYLKICDSSWLAESLGAGLLFPERRDRARRLYERLSRREGLRRPYEEVLALLESHLRAYLKAVPWSRFRVAGFSVCLNQLTLSLWAANLLKREHPHLVIVFGGALCAGELGRSLLEAFPFIDFVINREGERPLAVLIRALSRGGPEEDLPGIFFRKEGRVRGGGELTLPPEEIPSPVYDDYFQELNHLPPEKRFFPLIPLEASRGCWWGKCHFCNLNLQWCGYRRRPLRAVLRDIRLHAQAGLLDFAFMDNCLDRKEALTLFEELSRDGRDYRFFAELRAIYSAEEFRLLRRGGLYWVQIGIEALSTSLLRRLGKGTTAMANVAAMRHCEEAGLELSANLICHFPGTTEDEIRETLTALDYVFPFRPLQTVSFWLGYESPVFQNPERFGLRRIYPHPFYRYIFPPEVLRKMTPLAWAYQGDRKHQQRLWQPVIKKVKTWQKLWNKLYREHGPLLTYREGGDFLIIRQVTPEGRILHHRLRGLSREIYLFLTEPRSFREVAETFPKISAEKLRAFLDDLERKRLLFREGERFLALAVRASRG